MKYLKCYFLTLCLLLVSGYSFAGISSKADSLESLLTTISEPAEQMSILNQLVKEYRFKQPEIALSYGKRAISIGKQSNADSLLAVIYNNVGITYAMVNNQEEALNYFMIALELAESIEVWRTVNDAYNNIAGIFALQGGYDKAIDYVLKSIEIGENRDGALETLVERYNNLCFLYTKVGKYEKALFYASKAIEAVELSNLPEWILSPSYQEMGNIYRLRKEYQKSLLYLEKAKKGYHQKGNDIYAFEVSVYMAKVYIELKNYPKAISLVENALDGMIPANALAQIKDGYSVLHQAYKSANNYVKALETHEKLMAVKDTISSRNKDKVVQEISARFETELQEQEIENLEKEAEYQKEISQRAIIGLVLLSVALISILFLGLSFRSRVRLKQNLANRQRDLLEKEKARAIAEQKKLEAEKLLSQEEQKRLSTELDYRNRELSSSTMYMYQKHEMLEGLLVELTDLRPHIDEKGKKSYKSIQKSIQENMGLDNDWDKFKLHFENVHPNFFNKLHTSYPILTSNDLKLCAYIRMNMSNKEIARLLGINFRSVQVAKYRLKKKMELTEKEGLSEKIQTT